MLPINDEPVVEKIRQALNARDKAGEGSEAFGEASRIIKQNAFEWLDYLLWLFDLQNGILSDMQEDREAYRYGKQDGVRQERVERWSTKEPITAEWLLANGFELIKLPPLFAPSAEKSGFHGRNPYYSMVVQKGSETSHLVNIHVEFQNKNGLATFNPMAYVTHGMFRIVLRVMYYTWEIERLYEGLTGKGWKERNQ